MSHKLNEDHKLTPEALAAQLRKPDGESGKAIGLQMNKGNVHICLNAYKLLEVKDKQHILEIGMGNGFFVKDLLGMAEGLRYTGLDYSATMIEEATLLNKTRIKNSEAQFHLGSIEQLPFVENSFDAITTTNTIYFWPNPIENARELLRVMKPGGKLLIAYRDKSCMDQIEFTRHQFTKYASESVENLLSSAGFSRIETTSIEEPELNIDGKIFRMTGFYTIGKK